MRTTRTTYSNPTSSRSFKIRRCGKTRAMAWKIASSRTSPTNGASSCPSRAPVVPGPAASQPQRSVPRPPPRSS